MNEIRVQEILKTGRIFECEIEDFKKHFLIYKVAKMGTGLIAEHFSGERYAIDIIKNSISNRVMSTVQQANKIIAQMRELVKEFESCQLKLEGFAEEISVLNKENGEVK